METEETVKTMTTAEILETDFPEPEWIIPEIIPWGVTILSGYPKVGKSWFCLDIATTVSEGGMILGDMEVEQHETLYLCLEDSFRRIQKRLIKQKRKPSDNCHFRIEILQEEDEISWLKRWMEEYNNTKLIIIDTFMMFAKIRDINSYSQTVDSISKIKTFADECNVSVILVHHTSKNEKDNPITGVLGSIGISATVDTTISISKRNDDDISKLCIMGRDVEDQKLFIKLNTDDTFKWSLVDKSSNIPKIHQEVIDFIESNPEPTKAKDIIDHFDIKPNTMYRILSELVKNKLIERIRQGLYTKSKSRNCIETDDIFDCFDPFETAIDIYDPEIIGQTINGIHYTEDEVTKQQKEYEEYIQKKIELYPEDYD